MRQTLNGSANSEAKSGAFPHLDHSTFGRPRIGLASLDTPAHINKIVSKINSVQRPKVKFKLTQL